MNMRSPYTLGQKLCLTISQLSAWRAMLSISEPLKTLSGWSKPLAEVQYAQIWQAHRRNDPWPTRLITSIAPIASDLRWRRFCSDGGAGSHTSLIRHLMPTITHIIRLFGSARRRSSWHNRLPPLMLWYAILSWIIYLLLPDHNTH